MSISEFVKRRCDNNDDDVDILLKATIELSQDDSFFLSNQLRNQIDGKLLQP